MTCMKRDDPHPSLVRLLDAVGQIGLMNSRALAKALELEDGTVGNWASRGVSKPAAMAAQLKFGVSALWVLKSKGPQWTERGPITPPAPHPHGDIESDIATLSPSAVELALFFDDLTRAMARSDRAIVNAEAISAIRNQTALMLRRHPDASAPAPSAQPSAAPVPIPSPGKQRATHRS